MKLENLPLFTIPSGIVMTKASIAKDILAGTRNLYWTTKSIGQEERRVPEKEEVEHFDALRYANREPIVTQYAPGCWGNAVGLGNPGAVKAREDILAYGIPRERIVASIFGRSVEEFVEVARTLEDVVSYFELNLSCPHDKGHGLVIGQDLDLVGKIIKELGKAVQVPLIGKIGMNNVTESVKRIIEAGAIGISLINTIPGLYLDADGNPILWNPNGHIGGASGKGIFSFALKAVREARLAAPSVAITASGGISTANDVRMMLKYADHVAIGTALVGMTSSEIVNYFETLTRDLKGGTNYAEKLLEKVNMTYEKVKINEVINDGCDFRIFKMNRGFPIAKPGQFVFARIPGVGEKPFSVMDDWPLTLGVLERGYFTEKFNKLKKGDEFYFRGPYGKGIEVPSGSEVVLVGGGCGLAGLNLIVKSLSMGKRKGIKIFIGAKDKEHLAFLKEFNAQGKLYVATEDGSYGMKGRVDDLLKKEGIGIPKGTYFYNCGPRAMVDTVLPLELEVSSGERVYTSLDYMTMCGVGICGSCADEKGRRSCVEGPFMPSS